MPQDIKVDKLNLGKMNRQYIKECYVGCYDHPFEELDLQTFKRKSFNIISNLMEVFNYTTRMFSQKHFRGLYLLKTF